MGGHVYIVSNSVSGYPLNTLTSFTNAVPRGFVDSRVKYEVGLEAIGFHLRHTTPFDVVTVKCNQVLQRINGRFYDRFLRIFAVPNDVKTNDYFFHEFKKVIYCDFSQTEIDSISLELQTLDGQFLPLMTGATSIARLHIREKMAADSFVLRVISNDSDDVHSDNTSSMFRAKLAHPLILGPDWEVSLNSFSHPTLVPVHSPNSAHYLNILSIIPRTSGTPASVHDFNTQLLHNDTFSEFLVKFNEHVGLDYMTGARSGLSFELIDEVMVITFRKTARVKAKPALFRMLGMPHAILPTDGLGWCIFYGVAGTVYKYSRPWTENEGLIADMHGVVYVVQWATNFRVDTIELPSDDIPHTSISELEKMYGLLLNAKMEPLGLTLKLGANGKYKLVPKISKYMHIMASPDLMKMWGADVHDANNPYLVFISARRPYVLPHKPMFESRIPNLVLIYTDIIKPVLIGGNYARVLKVANIGGSSSGYVTHEFEKDEYAGLELNIINELEINIVQHDGSPLVFTDADKPCILSLAFRKKNAHAHVHVI